MSLLLADTSGFLPNQTHRRLSRGVPPVLSVAATEYPASLEDVKLACKIDFSDQDSLISDYLGAAVEDVQLDAEIALCTQTRIQYLDGFPAGAIEWRMPPLASVSSIVYYATDGTPTTYPASSYQVDAVSRPGLILPVYGTFWPVVRSQLQAVVVTAVCGYGAASAVPLTAKQAIYLRVRAALDGCEMDSTTEERYWSLIARLRWRGL